VLLVLVAAIPALAVFLIGPIGLMIYGVRRLRWMGGAKLEAAIAGWVVVLIAGAVIRSDFLHGAALLVLFLVEVAVLLWLALRRTTWPQRLASLAWIAPATLVVGLLVWFNSQPLIGYVLASQRCGHQPVIAAQVMALDSSEFDYWLPGDDGYGLSSLDDHFYCSATDAESAGYRRSGT